VQTDTPITTTFAGPFSHPSIRTSTPAPRWPPASHWLRTHRLSYNTPSRCPLFGPKLVSSDAYERFLHPHPFASEPVKIPSPIIPPLVNFVRIISPQRRTSCRHTCTYNRGSHRRAPDFGANININNTNDLYIRIDSPANINIVHPQPDTSPSTKSLVTPFALTAKYERRTDLPAYLPQHPRRRGRTASDPPPFYTF
jgi:hypothetical protein